MAGICRNLLLLSLAIYVVCMLVSLGDAAPIKDRSVRERRRIPDNDQRSVGVDVQKFDRALRKRRKKFTLHFTVKDLGHVLLISAHQLSELKMV